MKRPNTPKTKATAIFIGDCVATYIPASDINAVLRLIELKGQSFSVSIESVKGDW